MSKITQLRAENDLRRGAVLGNGERLFSSYKL